MNHITIPTSPSRLNLPRVYDLDTLKDVAAELNIKPTRPNIRRIRRAYDILEKGTLHFVGIIEGKARLYECQSDSRPAPHLHLLVSNGVTLCSCEDARRFKAKTGCKHSIAVRLIEAENEDAEAHQERIAS